MIGFGYHCPFMFVYSRCFIAVAVMARLESVPRYDRTSCLWVSHGNRASRTLCVFWGGPATFGWWSRSSLLVTCHMLMGTRPSNSRSWQSPWGLPWGLGHLRRQPAWNGHAGLVPIRPLQDDSVWMLRPSKINLQPHLKSAPCIKSPAPSLPHGRFGNLVGVGGRHTETGPSLSFSPSDICLNLDLLTDSFPSAFSFLFLLKFFPFQSQAKAIFMARGFISQKEDDRRQIF